VPTATLCRCYFDRFESVREYPHKRETFEIDSVVESIVA